MCHVIRRLNLQLALMHFCTAPVPKIATPIQATLDALAWQNCTHTSDHVPAVHSPADSAP